VNVGEKGVFIKLCCAGDLCKGMSFL